MKRHVSGEIVKTSEVLLTSPKTNGCDKAHASLFHNSTWLTQPCFPKDISYTIEATVGDVRTRNFELLNFQVNIRNAFRCLRRMNQRWTLTSHGVG